MVTNTLSSFKYNTGKCTAVEEDRQRTSTLLCAAVTVTSLALGAGVDASVSICSLTVFFRVESFQPIQHSVQFTHSLLRRTVQVQLLTRKQREEEEEDKALNEEHIGVILWLLCLAGLSFDLSL